MGESRQDWWPTVPGYELIRELGRGGFGVVFEATQLAVGRSVALKVLSTSHLDDDTLRRFRAECQTVGRLSWHPHVVALYDAGQTSQGMPYLAMELLPGGSLGDQVRQQGRLAPGDVARVGREVSDALSAAHDIGVVHRDIKPDNLMVGHRGEVLVTDFGIATLTDSTASATGSFVGSIAYSPPERLRGERATPATDVYSLGATLYTLAAGRPAFALDPTDPPATVVWRITSEDPPPLPPDTPPALAQIIGQAMAKDPGQRFSTPGDLSGALAAIATDGPEAATTVALPSAAPVDSRPAPSAATTPLPVAGGGSPPTAPPAGAPRRGRPWGLVAAGVFALLVLVGAGIALWPDGGDGDEGPGQIATGQGTEVERGAEVPVAQDEGCEPATDIPPADDKPDVEVPTGSVPTELVVTDIKVGDGTEATLGATIRVHYVGVACSTGRQFDASWDRGEPTELALAEGQLIEGWVQGIPGMRVGGRRMLVVPPDMAYGDEGQGDDIGPGETLVFVVDLVGVADGGEGRTASGPVELPEPPPGGTISTATPCPADDGSEPRVATFAQPPPTCIDAGQPLEAVMETSAGTLTIALDGDAAPTMVNNFVVLARYKFFDGLPFHRLVPDFVVQGGSSGIPDYGSGGPGYSLPDIEKPTDGYAPGDLAMARAADVSGSQFFIVASEAGAAQLTNDYPRFGRVVDGLDLVADLAGRGDVATNGAPTDLVTITSVSIRPA